MYPVKGIQSTYNAYFLEVGEGAGLTSLLNIEKSVLRFFAARFFSIPSSLPCAAVRCSGSGSPVSLPSVPTGTRR